MHGEVYRLSSGSQKIGFYIDPVNIDDPQSGSEVYSSTIVRIDPSLEKYKDKVLFPVKLTKANDMLKTAETSEKKAWN